MLKRFNIYFIFSYNINLILYFYAYMISRKM